MRRCQTTRSLTARARVYELPRSEPATALPANYPPPYISPYMQEQAALKREHNELLRALLAKKEREPPSPPEPTPQPESAPSAEPKEPFSYEALRALFRRSKGTDSVRNRDVAKETADACFGLSVKGELIRLALAAEGIKGKPGPRKT